MHLGGDVMHMTLEGWHIDVAARTARRGDITECFSPRAIRLLKVLADAKGEVVPRSELLKSVWPNIYASDESLTQVISEIRRTLKNKNLIATIPRGGYRLTVEVEEYFQNNLKQNTRDLSGIPLDAYTLCLEAMECFSRACEGAEHTAVDLSATAASLAPCNADTRALHAAFLLKKHMIWSGGAQLAERALEEVEAALAIDPNHPLANFIGASARIMTGLPGYGANNLDNLFSLASSDAALHSDASILMHWMGRRKSSIMMALKASRIEPDRFGDEMNAARLLMSLDPAWARKHAESALAKVRQQLQINPNSVPALYALGPLLAQVGEVHAARAALEGVAEHKTPLEFFRAMGFAMIGDTSAALERLEFIASRGWRMAKLLDEDESFISMSSDTRYQRFRGELMAA